MNYPKWITTANIFIMRFLQRSIILLYLMYCRTHISCCTQLNWFLHIDVYVLFNYIHTSYYLQERRYCPTAPIHLARSTGCSPGRCMDNKFYVRFSLPIFFRCTYQDSWDYNSFISAPWAYSFSKCFLILLLCHYICQSLWMIYQYFLFKIFRLLKAIVRFNDLVVSVYVTAGNILSIMSLIGW